LGEDVAPIVGHPEEIRERLGTQETEVLEGADGGFEES